MLSALGARARTWADAQAPWTNVYGVARSMLAISAIITLAGNDAGVLFAPTSLTASVGPTCVGVRSASAFCVAGAAHLDLARWILVAVLVVIASGWRPRITGVVHWWIAFSVQASLNVADGGDHVTEMLTLLVVPVTLTDPRVWHWSEMTTTADRRDELRRIVALVTLTVIRVQVAGIYFHAAAGKFATQAWADGTAMYYWLGAPEYGAPAWLAPLLRPILLHPVGVTLLTWSVVVLEFGLAAGLVVSKRHWKWLLMGGVALHGGIIVVHGLVSFGLVMMAALVLAFRPISRPFACPRWLARFRVVASSVASRRAAHAVDRGDVNRCTS